jgi:hypothetical protein
MHCRYVVLLAMGAGLGIALVASGDAQAASVGCTPRSSHPICLANYAAYPSALRRASARRGAR